MPDAAAVAGMVVNLMIISSSLCCKKIACLQGAQSAVRENASFRQIAGIMCDTILAVLSGVAIGFAGLLISQVSMLHKLVPHETGCFGTLLWWLQFCQPLHLASKWSLLPCQGVMPNKGRCPVELRRCLCQ